MRTLVIFVLLWATVSSSDPLGSTISYQGELQQLGAPANGLFDFQVDIFDIDVGGVAIGNQVLLEDVHVSDGVFLLDLDFGIAPFAGDQLWLEIGVRQGASTGSHTPLLPRQKLTAAPYALHAEMVAMGAVGSGEVNPGQVQLRVGSSCAVGASIRSIDQSGTVICETDDVGLTAVTGNEIVDSSITAVDLAAGAVTGAAIAPGAVGSPQVLDDSLTAADLAADAVGASELATDAVDSAAIAAGAVGGSDIDSSQVQSRVIGTCPTAHYVSGINQDGSVNCTLAPFGVKSNVDGGSLYSSVAVRSDGRPLVAYQGFGSPGISNPLTVFDCADVVCSTGTVRALGPLGASWPTIAIRTNGLPMISYQGANNLKLYDCSASDCSAGADRTLDGTTGVGVHTDIAIRSNGLPIISYADSDNANLKVFHCIDVACSGGVARTLDNGQLVGAWTSIAIRNDGTPIISYHDFGNEDLKVYRCSETDCSNGSAITVDSGGAVGEYTSIATRIGNPPIISYYDRTNNRLKVFQCTRVGCHQGTARFLGNSVGGLYSSLAIPPSGLPIIAHVNPTTYDVKVLDCENEDCTFGFEHILAPADGVLTMDIAIRPGGLPFISHGIDRGFLAVYSCGDERCQN